MRGPSWYQPNTKANSGTHNLKDLTARDGSKTNVDTNADTDHSTSLRK